MVTRKEGRKSLIIKNSSARCVQKCSGTMTHQSVQFKRAVSDMKRTTTVVLLMMIVFVIAQMPQG